MQKNHVNQIRYIDNANEMKTPIKTNADESVVDTNSDIDLDSHLSKPPSLYECILEDYSLSSNLDNLIPPPPVCQKDNGHRESNSLDDSNDVQEHFSNASIGNEDGPKLRQAPRSE